MDLGHISNHQVTSLTHHEGDFETAKLLSESVSKLELYRQVPIPIPPLLIITHF